MVCKVIAWCEGMGAKHCSVPRIPILARETLGINELAKMQSGSGGG